MGPAVDPAVGPAVDPVGLVVDPAVGPVVGPVASPAVHGRQERQSAARRPGARVAAATRIPQVLRGRRGAADLRERARQERRRLTSAAVGSSCKRTGRGRPDPAHGAAPTSRRVRSALAPGRGGPRSTGPGARSAAAAASLVPARRLEGCRWEGCRSAGHRAGKRRSADRHVVRPRAEARCAVPARAARRAPEVRPAPRHMAPHRGCRYRGCRHDQGRRSAGPRPAGPRPAGTGRSGRGAGVRAGEAGAGGAASRPGGAAVARSRLPRRLPVGLTRRHRPPRRPGSRRRTDRGQGRNRGDPARAWEDRTRHGRGRCRHVPPVTSWTLVSSRAAGQLPLRLECRSPEIPCMT